MPEDSSQSSSPRPPRRAGGRCGASVPQLKMLDNVFEHLCLPFMPCGADQGRQPLLVAFRHLAIPVHTALAVVVEAVAVANKPRRGGEVLPDAGGGLAQAGQIGSENRMEVPPFLVASSISNRWLGSSSAQQGSSRPRREACPRRGGHQIPEIVLAARNLLIRRHT